MSRESIKGFALGLFVSTAFLGGYYFLEEKDKKEITIEQLEEASEELGYTLVKTGDDSAEEKESMKEVEEPFSQESDSLPEIQTSGNSTKASQRSFRTHLQFQPEWAQIKLPSSYSKTILLKMRTTSSSI